MSSAPSSVCPECIGTGFKKLPHGDGYVVVLPCATCSGTGQQPAQPESGEVVRYNILAAALGKQSEMPYHYEMVMAKDFDRLQSSLTAAQRENAALRNLAANLQPGPISEALSGQRYTTETELRDQLTAAHHALGRKPQ